MRPEIDAGGAILFKIEAYAVTYIIAAEAAVLWFSNRVLFWITPKLAA